MNVVLIGEESAGIKTLRLLSEMKHNVVSVLSTPPTGSNDASVWKVARQMGYDVLPASAVRDPALATELLAVRVDMILNVHSLFVVRKEILDIPRVGSFNLHPGMLPYYAGLNAPSWALHNGESMHGVTVHWMEPGIDTGAIAFQKEIAIGKTDTGLSLSLKCAKEGIALLRRLLKAGNQNTIPCVPQDLSKRKYYGKEIPNDGVIRWDQPAATVVNFVRSFDYYPFASPWGSPRETFDGSSMFIHKVLPTEIRCDDSPGMIRKQDGMIFVATNDYWVHISHFLIDGRSVVASNIVGGNDSFRIVPSNSSN